MLPPTLEEVEMIRSGHPSSRFSPAWAIYPILERMAEKRINALAYELLLDDWERRS